jgi:hypothetical protein
VGACRKQPPPCPHPSRHSLELPLRPLPAARILTRYYLLASTAYAVQLLFTGHWVMATGMGLLTTASLFALRRMAPRGPVAPRRLLLAADGRMHVACVGGAVEPVELAGESLWLGSAVLLVLQAPERCFRVLLGRGNLDPASLAALRRRLRGATTARPDPAVDSRASHRHSASPVEQFTRGNTS